MTARASNIDLILACSAAAKKPEVKIDRRNAAAEMGTAVHAALAEWITVGAKGEPNPQPAANEFGVDAREVARLCSYAPEALGCIKEAMDDMRTEVSFQTPALTGTCDVLSIIPAANGVFGISILDWKTGRDASHSKPGQLLAYAALATNAHGMPATGYIYTAEIWLQERLIIERRYDKASIDGLWRRLGRQLEHQDVHSPGTHCRFCPRAHECSARETYYRSAISSLVVAAETKPTRESLAELWEQSRLLKQALAVYESCLDDALADGPLPLPDGREIVLVEQSRDQIDARKAWPVMTAAGLTQDDIASVLSVKKSALLDVVGNRAKRGEKASQRKNIMIQLDQAGAITRRTFNKKQVKDGQP